MRVSASALTSPGRRQGYALEASRRSRGFLASPRHRRGGATATPRRHLQNFRSIAAANASAESLRRSRGVAVMPMHKYMNNKKCIWRILFCVVLRRFACKHHAAAGNNGRKQWPLREAFSGMLAGTPRLTL